MNPPTFSKGFFLLFLCFLTTSLRADDPLRRADPLPYRIQSPFWQPRIKHLVVNYVPYVMDLLENDRGQWKLFSRLRAAREKLAGRSPFNSVTPEGPDWLDAQAHNVFESMCYALMVDPQGDPEMISAQEKIRAGVERWIPIILGAQHSDGYLCSQTTLQGYERWKSGRGFDRHEGYQMGYFLEAAIAHSLLTSGTDRRMYDAAKKTADLWCNTIGNPPKISWQPDHTEMKQALCRFGLFVNQMEGPGNGDKYIRLAEWIAENRGVVPDDGFRQKDKPLTEQQEPYAHAVIGAYFYSGAAWAAHLTGNARLQGAVDRLWNGLVNTRMFLTGAIGSQGECFQKAFELPNDSSLGESCANIAHTLFQENMALLHSDARYVDVAEQTLYNAVLGAIAAEEPKWQYFNPLDQGAEHARQNRNIDCCMGNLSRILLQLPSWTYSQNSTGINVNLFLGSSMKLRNVAGTDVEMVQQTNYPWDGKVAITLNPSKVQRFAVRVRIPSGYRGDLYRATPEQSPVKEFSVNGTRFPIRVEKGYAVIDRLWRAGDRIDFVIPLQAQKITSDSRITCNQGRVALQYGPLTYVVETADHEGEDPNSLVLDSREPLQPQWEKDFFGGAVLLHGKSTNGQPMTAVPYFLRGNRQRSAWNHIASTYDGETHSLYVNGQLAIQRKPGKLAILDGPLHIGEDPLGQKRYFSGTIANAAVYSQALEAGQIAKLAQNRAIKPAEVGVQPVYELSEAVLEGSKPMVEQKGIGISGNQPWTLAAWVQQKNQPKQVDYYRAHLFPQSHAGEDNLGYGIIGWGGSGPNQCNFIYYVPSRSLFAGFGGNDVRATTGFQIPNRAIVWIRSQ